MDAMRGFASRLTQTQGRGLVKVVKLLNKAGDEQGHKLSAAKGIANLVVAFCIEERPRGLRDSR